MLGMLSVGVHRSTSAAVAGSHQVIVGPQGPGVDAHALFAPAASAASVFALLLVFAGVIWLLLRSQRPSGV